MGWKSAALREIDTGSHGRVRRGVQEEELGDAEPQDVVHLGCARRQRIGEAIGDQRVDLAKAAQHGRHQKPREGAVAERQFRHCRAVVYRLVERPLTPQHPADQIKRYMTSR
jgi:hypothetical protein